MEYSDIIARKTASTESSGMIVSDGEIAPHLFPHQRDLVRWALRRGRAAIFADTGLGKGLMLLEWARHVSAGGRVIVLAPLAVGPQLAAEAARFGVDAKYMREDDGVAPIVVTNYEILHAFNPSRFVGVVLDESSILKSYDGKTKQRLIDAFSSTPYRLACTATPAPNDFTELGNHSEFLGLKRRTEMLAEYFVHDGGSTQDWRIKGHALVPFWRWVATWGAVVKMPSDLGYEDGAFTLPPLEMVEHVVPSTDHDHKASGMLFAMEARTLQEQRAVKRGTIGSRVAKAAAMARSYACRGILNTPPIEKLESASIQSTPLADAASDRGRRKKTANTCGPTTSETNRSSITTAERINQTSTLASDLGTQAIPRSASTTSAKLARGSKRTPSESSTPDCAKPTGSPSSNTTDGSSSKTTRARSAGSPTTPTADDSTSTTATQPAPFADCSADHATSGSGSSTTNPTDSAPPPTTSSESVIVWCELNDEQDQLAKELGDLCVSIQGSDDDDAKIERCHRWLRGEVPILITKPACFGFGLNFQHCHRVIFIGASHSYERTYQAIRRCWRFGQASAVTVDLVRSDLEAAIVENYRRKESDAAKMAREMTAHVGAAVRAEVRGLSREFNEYRPAAVAEVPSWIRSSM